MSGSPSNVRWISTIHETAGILVRKFRQWSDPVYISVSDLFALYAKESFQIQCYPDNSDLVVLNNIGHFIVPEMMNDWYLVNIQVHVSIVSTSGLPTFMIRNYTNGNNNMISVPITIDENELDSINATTIHVINTNYDQVSVADRIEFDCMVKGTGTKGLMIIPTFSRKRI